MQCPSIHQIITDHGVQEQKNDIKMLFTRKQYGIFEIKQFYQSFLYHQHQYFDFFLTILEQWNRKVQRGELKEYSEAYFRRNLFIFTSLKSTLVQEEKNRNRMLLDLYSWYNSRMIEKIVPRVRMENPAEMKESEWDIRNTFKSNLPLEINLYKRRMFATEEINQTYRNQGDKDNLVKQYNKMFEVGKKEKHGQVDKEAYLIKINNEIVRAEREKEELRILKRQWSNARSRDSQKSTKKWFQGKFALNKLIKEERFIQEIPEPKKHLKKSRLMTSQGFRTSRQETQLFFDQAKKSQAKRNKFVNRFSTVGPEDDQPSRANVTNICGFGLFENPFASKLKKGKRKK